ncbi:serine hydrolase domain-containing protein [Candidatus Korobacter versatilis]|uniref:serine hydrolase domain-containing protein n=1 Tax=Candidatus Korobacter versatilis TaxID=658062 RepID=UPI0002DD33B5|nr:serine hydrolase domain-containing protein [Candidatus Koribacter versatilis]
MNQSELVAKLRSHMDELSRKDEFSGVVLLAKDGVPVFEQAYGLANREYNVPNNIETKFNLGSINKLFTRIAIGQLVIEGKVGLDDPMGKYLPDYPNKEAQKATIRQIAMMRSGIGDFFGAKFRDTPKDRIRTIADFMALLAAEPLAFEPGTKEAYSNGGFVVLGAVIEKVSGQSYYDYVREHICKRLGMESTDFYEADGMTSNLATGYTSQTEDDDHGPRRNNIYTRPARGSSAGGGYSTARDLLKLANALEARKLTNPVFAPDVPKPADMPFAALRGTGIAGGAPGINADMESSLPGGYTVIVLSNYDPPSATKVARQVREWMGLREY